MRDWDTCSAYVLHNSTTKFNTRTLVESGSSNDEDEGSDLPEEFDEDESFYLFELDGEQDHFFGPPVCVDRRDNVQAGVNEAHAVNPSSSQSKEISLHSSVSHARQTWPMTLKKKTAEYSGEKYGLKHCSSSPSKNSSESIGSSQHDVLDLDSPTYRSNTISVCDSQFLGSDLSSDSDAEFTRVCPNSDCTSQPERRNNKSVNVLELSLSNGRGKEKAMLLHERLGKSTEDSSSYSSAVPETDSEDIPYFGSISSAKTRRSSPEKILCNTFAIRALNVRQKGGVPYRTKVASAPSIGSRIRGRNARKEKVNNVGGSCIRDDEPPSCGNEDPENYVCQKSVSNSRTPERKHRKFQEEASNDDSAQELHLSDCSNLQSNASGEGGKKTGRIDGVGYASSRTGSILSSGSRQKLRDDSYGKSHNVTFLDEVEDGQFFSPASVGDSSPSTESHASVVNAELKTTPRGKESVCLAGDLPELGNDELVLGISKGGGELLGQRSDEAVPVNTWSRTSKRSSPGGKELADKKSCSGSKRSMHMESLSSAKMPLQKQNFTMKSPSVRVTTPVEQQVLIEFGNGKGYVSPARKNASVHEAATSPSNIRAVVREVSASPSKRSIAVRDISSSPSKSCAAFCEVSASLSKERAPVCKISASLSKRGAIYSSVMSSDTGQEHDHEKNKEIGVVANTCRKSCPVLETLNKFSDTAVESRLQPIVLLTRCKVGSSTSFKLMPPKTVTREVGPSDHPGGSSIRVSPSKTQSRLSHCSWTSKETPLWLGSVVQSFTVTSSTLKVENEDDALPITPTSNNIITLNDDVTPGSGRTDVLVMSSDKAVVSVKPRPSRKKKIRSSKTEVIAGTSNDDVVSRKATTSSKLNAVLIKQISEVECSVSKTNLKSTVAENLPGTCRQAGEKPKTAHATDGNSGQDEPPLKRGHSCSPKRRASKKVCSWHSNKVVEDTDVRRTSQRSMLSRDSDGDSSDTSSDSSSLKCIAKQIRCHFDYGDYYNFAHHYDPTYHPGAANKSRAKRVVNLRHMYANHRTRPRGPQYSSNEDASLLRNIKVLNPKLQLLGGNEFWRKMEKLDELQGEGRERTLVAGERVWIGCMV